MSKARERRKWTEEEDSLLREAVNKVNRESRPLLWRELAKSVPGRTNKDCRRRWCNTIADGMTKGTWTISEDERLSRAVQVYGSVWTRVAAAVGTRTSDQCSSHWSQTLNPSIDYSDWTIDEDEKLIAAVKRWGTNWARIASAYIPNRTALALKNRHSALCTKGHRARASPKQNAASKTTNRKISGRQSIRRPNQSGAGRSPNEEGGDQTDDDDEHEDDDDEDEDRNTDEEDRPTNTENLPDMDWQGGLLIPITSNTTSGRADQFPQQSAPLCLPDPDVAQHNGDLTPISIEQWTSGAQQAPSMFPNANQINFAQNNYFDNNSYMPVLSNLDANPTPSPSLLHQYQYPPKLDVSQATLPSPDSTTGSSHGIEVNGEGYSTQSSQRRYTKKNSISSPTSGTGPPRDAIAREGYDQTQTRVNRAHESGPGVQQSVPSQQYGMTLPSGQDCRSLTPPLAGEKLQRVSLEILCTVEQLSTIMTTAISNAKLVTVKMES